MGKSKNRLWFDEQYKSAKANGTWGSSTPNAAHHYDTIKPTWVLAEERESVESLVVLENQITGERVKVALSDEKYRILRLQTYVENPSRQLRLGEDEKVQQPPEPTQTETELTADEAAFIDDDPLYDFQDASQHMGKLPISYIKRMVADGELDHVMVGNCPMVRLSTLDDFITSHTTAADPYFRHKPKNIDHMTDVQLEEHRRSNRMGDLLHGRPIDTAHGLLKEMAAEVVRPEAWAYVRALGEYVKFVNMAAMEQLGFDPETELEVTITITADSFMEGHHYGNNDGYYTSVSVTSATSSKKERSDGILRRTSDFRERETITEEGGVLCPAALANDPLDTSTLLRHINASKAFSRYAKIASGWLNDTLIQMGAMRCLERISVYLKTPMEEWKK